MFTSTRRSAIRGVLLLAGAVSTAIASSGCQSGRPIDFGSTPAYSSHDRHAMIWRNWNYEGAQAVDDWDSLMLLRPAGRMSPWHVR